MIQQYVIVILGKERTISPMKWKLALSCDREGEKKQNTSLMGVGVAKVFSHKYETLCNNSRNFEWHTYILGLIIKFNEISIN